MSGFRAPARGAAVVLMLSWAGDAAAASLDSLEVGGPWGTPAATDGTALWWNPAGLAGGEGTRITLEGAPTFATVDIERDDPHGGTDRIKLSGLVPYAGIATDLGVEGLGLGIGLGLPFVRGGHQDPEAGPVRYHLRDGEVKAVALMAGGGYELGDMVALGAAVHVMQSSWAAVVDNELMPDLADEIAATGQDPGYTDADLEDPDYAATLDFDNLTDMAVTWAAGVRAKPIEEVVLSVTHVAGFHVDNQGPLTMDFSCPPQTDTLGRFGAEAKGLCDTTMTGVATVSYDLPGRWNFSIQGQPTPGLFIEGMGGIVYWHVLRDYDIVIDRIAEENPDVPDDTVALVERTQAWARDNEDSFWLGLDVKGTVQDRYTMGGRLLYDKAAVPDQALLANNFDTDTVTLGGLFAARIVDQLQVGVSWSHYFLRPRRVTDSAFSMSVDPSLRPEDRYNYPHGNGTYGGTIDRLGVAVQVAL